MRPEGLRLLSLLKKKIKRRFNDGALALTEGKKTVVKQVLNLALLMAMYNKIQGLKAGVNRFQTRRKLKQITKRMWKISST